MKSKTVFLIASVLASTNAVPVLKKRAPQTYSDNPGQIVEATSLVASLYGDGESALFSWLYGDTGASSTYQAPTSTADSRDNGSSDNGDVWSEATSAVESVWSEATDGVVDNWTSYTSAYDSFTSEAAAGSSTPTTADFPTTTTSATFNSTTTTSASSTRTTSTGGASNLHVDSRLIYGLATGLALALFM